MTRLLEKALEAVQAWPPERQDEAAELLMWLAERDAVVHELSPEEQAAIEQSMAAVCRGEFATEEEVEAAYARFRT